MKITKILALIFLLSLSLHLTAQEETPEATASIRNPLFVVEGDGIALDVYFNSVKQGRAALLGLRGDGIESAEFNVFLRNGDFFQIEGSDTWWAIFSAEMGQSNRRYDLTVTVQLEGQSQPQVLLTRFDVVNGGFLQQSVTLAPDPALETLLSPEVEAAEFAEIFSRATIKTDEALWDSNGISYPLIADLTSPFGAVRVFNGTFNTVHTGWDFQVNTGIPELAAAAGEVVFAGVLPIRGNYVLINHGQGIYTGYAHLSVIYVTQGQSISYQQVIGMVGSTGRSSSAHAHFEAIVDGNWVDPIDLVRMGLP